MMKTLLCIALVLSMTQGSPVLDLLKKMLEEKELEERGVYKVSKTSTSVSGTVQIDINDCPKPEDGCLYTITATNTRGNDAKTKSMQTSSRPIAFTFDGLDPGGAYEVTACTLVNGQYRCGPKVALCDLRTRNTRCDYTMAKRELEKRGVMGLTAGSDFISGTVQININDCPKPYDCDYVVTCKNDQSGDTAQFTVNTKNSATRPFKCSGLSGGVYKVSACKSGSGNQCGPRVGSCDLSSGKCSLKLSNNAKSLSDKESVINEIRELLNDLK